MVVAVVKRNHQPHGVVIKDMRSIQPADLEIVGNTRPLLRLVLFGQMQAEDTAGGSLLPRSRKTRGVLAVLAMEAPRPVLRSRLTALLWSGRAKEQARGSLRQSVYELQHSLGPRAGGMLRSDRNRLALLSDGLWVDTKLLEAATVANPHGLVVYRPALLDDLDGLDPAFDEWLGEQRRRMAQRALSVAEGMLAVEDDPMARIAAAERLLSIDRVHERAWQALIRGHIEQGDRAAARFAYERCASNLASAGLAPSPEIEALVWGAPPDRSNALVVGRRAPRAGGVRLCVLPPRTLDSDTPDGILPGLAEEMTAAMSRFRWISCMTGGAPTVGSEIAKPADRRERLDVDYLLDSTMQCSRRHMRIIVRLLDLHAGSNVIWAQRFDREVDDALAVQGEIAAETSAQIDPELLMREGERRTADGSQEMSAFDLTLRAIPSIYRLEPSSFHAAGDLLAAAVALEPGSAAAHAWWAYWHLLLVGQAWADEPFAATARAGELADRAVTLDPGDARALTLVGHVRGFLHKRPEEACVLHERALSLNPNLPLAWCFSGLAHSYLGRHEEAVEQITRAQFLSPHDPHAFFFDMALMMPHFLQGEFAKAQAVGRRAIELNPGFTSTYKGYLATLGQLGLEQEAGRVLARLLALEPRFCIRCALEQSPMTRQSDLALYADGLRRAGLHED